MGRAHKTNARLTSEDVCKLVAKRCSLTNAQVTEALNAFSDFYIQLIGSTNVPDDLEVYFPNLGSFRFKHYKGKKKGDTYRMFQQVDGEFGTRESIMYTVEEDQPDFDIPMFKFKNCVNATSKEASKIKYARRMEAERRKNK